MILLLLGLANMSNVGKWVYAALMLLLLVFSLRWAYRDAEARGKSGCVVAGLVFLIGWPFSLLVWMIFRPNEYAEEHVLEEKPVTNKDWIECEQCGIKIRRDCTKCMWCEAERVPGPPEIQGKELV